MSELKSTPLKAWALANGFTAVHPEVRTNKNGYPFLTFIKPDGKGGNIGENVYFSKPASDTAIGMGKITASDREQMLACEVTNEDGEKRVKLAFAGENSYEAI